MGKKDREKKEDHFRKQVIAACGQDDVLHFERRFPPECFGNYLQFDCGSYSRVCFVQFYPNQKRYVMKLIKLRRSKLAKAKALSNENQLEEACGSYSKYQQQQEECNKKKNTIEEKQLDEYYRNVFQEIIIAKCLSNLHATQCDRHGYEYRAHCFPKVFRTALVNGKIWLEDRYIDTSNEYAIICMEDCGQSLRKVLRYLSVAQIAGIVYQLLLGMIAAEALYEYEHRDLHLANVLVRKTRATKLRYVIRGKRYSVTTRGIRAFVIDNTFARARIGPEIYYTHLSDKLNRKWTDVERNMADDETNANGEKPRVSITDQDRVYARMFVAARDDWSRWNSRTNLYWLRHIVRRLIGKSDQNRTFFAKQTNSKGKKILEEEEEEEEDEDDRGVAELRFLQKLFERCETLADVAQHVHEIANAQTV